MTKRCDPHDVYASMGTWCSHRRARPSQYSLTGPLLPAHAHPVHSCRHHRPTRANAPLKDGSDAMIQPLFSPLRSAYTALLHLSAAPSASLKIQRAQHLTTGLFNPELCGGSAPHEFLFR